DALRRVRRGITRIEYCPTRHAGLGETTKTVRLSQRCKVCPVVVAARELRDDTNRDGGRMTHIEEVSRSYGVLRLPHDVEIGVEIPDGLIARAEVAQPVG